MWCSLPILLPGGAVTPAMKAATGLWLFLVTRLCSFKKSAAFSSADPPISPIRTIPKNVCYYTPEIYTVLQLSRKPTLSVWIMEKNF